MFYMSDNVRFLAPNHTVAQGPEDNNFYYRLAHLSDTTYLENFGSGLQ
jgi:hypothetical protein